MNYALRLYVSQFIVSSSPDKNRYSENPDGFHSSGPHTNYQAMVKGIALGLLIGLVFRQMVFDVLGQDSLTGLILALGMGLMYHFSTLIPIRWLWNRSSHSSGVIIGVVIIIYGHFLIPVIDHYSK